MSAAASECGGGATSFTTTRSRARLRLLRCSSSTNNSAAAAAANALAILNHSSSSSDQPPHQDLRSRTSSVAAAAAGALQPPPRPPLFIPDPVDCPPAPSSMDAATTRPRRRRTEEEDAAAAVCRHGFSAAGAAPARSIINAAVVADDSDNIMNNSSASTETQSSSKTMQSHHHHRSSSQQPPLLPYDGDDDHHPHCRDQQPDHPFFFSFLPHLGFSFVLLLSLLTISALLLFSSSSSNSSNSSFLLSFKHKLPFFASSSSESSSSRQLLELRDSLAISLHTTAARLEAQVAELRLEMQEDSHRRRLELQEIRDELHNSKNNTMLSMQQQQQQQIHHPINTKEDDNIDPESHLAMASSSDEGRRPDYALSSGGGRILSHSPPFEVKLQRPAISTFFLPTIHSASSSLFEFFFSPRPRLHPLSSIILQPSFNQPGQCLPLAGSNVYVDIALRSPIFPDQVTLTHVSKSIAYDISSAPKEFNIYGSFMTSAEEEAPWILLGEFRYDIDKARTAQVFNLSESALATTIKLHVLSNYGSPSHTCIYRLQVHGHEPSSSSH